MLQEPWLVVCATLRDDRDASLGAAKSREAAGPEASHGSRGLAAGLQCTAEPIGPDQWAGAANPGWQGIGHWRTADRSSCVQSPTPSLASPSSVLTDCASGRGGRGRRASKRDRVPTRRKVCNPTRRWSCAQCSAVRARRRRILSLSRASRPEPR